MPLATSDDAMFTLLRYGVPSDKDLFTDAGLTPLYDGIVVPAHILAFSHQALPAFLYHMREKPYVIDPMTYMYQNVRSYSDDWGTRRSARKLAEAMGGVFGDTVREATELDGGGDTLQLLSDGAVLQSLGEGTVEFQLNAVPRVVTTQIDRYRSGAASASMLPEWVLAPYFHFEDTDDDWYAPCLQMQNAARDTAARAGHPIVPVVCTDVTCLESPANRQELLRFYGTWEAPAVVLWINKFRQSGASSTAIEAVRRFVSELNGQQYRKKTVMLYGGYLTLLLRHAGVRGICHGIFYGEDKDVKRVPPGGAPPDRYYLPLFHEFRMMSHAVRILSQADAPSDLMCECPVCSSVLRGDPGRLPLMWDSEQLKRHFLHVRASEKEHVRELELPDLLQELSDTYQQYHAMVAAVPDPEAKTREFLPGLDYLEKWGAGLS